jgi:hypothetical protein
MGADERRKWPWVVAAVVAIVFVGLAVGGRLIDTPIDANGGEPDVDDRRVTRHVTSDHIAARKAGRKVGGFEASECECFGVGCRSCNDVDRNGQRSGIRDGG